jgi:hypothetical protein
VIRSQPVPKLPGYTSHFRIFVLASGGIETKDHALTAAAFERHIRTMLAALSRLEDHGYAFGARRGELDRRSTCSMALGSLRRPRSRDPVAQDLLDRSPRQKLVGHSVPMIVHCHSFKKL